MTLPSGTRVFSAIQPTGVPHIGNYLGALKQWVALQRAGNDCTWSIADQHAITAHHDTASFHTRTLTTAAALIAIGIDPERSTLFIQSHVPAHTEAAWILMSLAKFSELQRMTQFKEKSGGALSANAGLFAYPVLQAADILLYRTDVVPVGEDQVQHLELARALARRFNDRYGRLLTEPATYVIEETARIMSLTNPTKKMSKSDDPRGAILLTDSRDDMRQNIQRAVTDSGTAVDPDHLGPALTNLLRIHAAFSERTTADVAEEFSGKPYTTVKQALTDLLVERLTPLKKTIAEQLEHEEQLLAILQLGARKATDVSLKTLREMKRRMGFTQVS